MDEHCIFCQIIAGKSPGTVLYQDAQVIVLKDIYPQAPVHWMVISKQHIGELLEAPDDLLSHMMTVVKKVIRDGHIQNYRIVNNGKGAAFVDHLHVHVLGSIDKARKL